MKREKLQRLKFIIPIIIVGISIIVLINSISINHVPFYHYQMNQDTDYKVYLKENDFINKKYLEKGQVYLQNIVRYIELNFLYNYEASLKDTISYQYDITSILTINYANTNQTLINKEYPIIENKQLEQVNSNLVQIKENINIDYQKYYQEVQRFKEQFNLPVNASLKVKFTIELKNAQGNKKISASEVTIDLTSHVFEIKVQEVKDEEDTILEVQKIRKKVNYPILIITNIFIILSLIYFLYQIKKYQLSKVTKFEREIKEILKRYGEIIVELEKEPDIEFKNIIDVKSFDELIDVEEEIREPILYYQKNEEAIFLIIDHEITYRKIIQ